MFTRAFLEGIQVSADVNHDGIVTEEELIADIRPIVVTEANSEGYQQVPQYSPLTRLDRGQFVFIVKHK
jgi:hypothetical protein